jgi:hypothetical protein
VPTPLRTDHTNWPTNSCNSSSIFSNVSIPYPTRSGAWQGPFTDAIGRPVQKAHSRIAAPSCYFL